MKRIAIILLTLIGLAINALPALAAGKAAIVTAQDISISDEPALIPVTISDNPGIMGFRITIEYPSDLINITNVTAGNVTVKGSFIHNLGKSNNQIDVIWFSSEESIDDGTFFVITAKAKPLLKEKESATILLSYSQEDTFNEKYEDVELDCRSFSVSYGQNEITDNNPSLSETENATVTVEYSDSQIIAAVDAAIGDSYIESIDQTTFDNIISNLNIISGVNSSDISTIDDLKQRYIEAVKNEYVKSVQTNIEPQIIADTINNSLNQYGANAIPDLTSEEAKSAIDEINKLDKDLTDISKSISDDDMIEILNELYDDTNSKNDDQKSSDWIWMVILGGILVLLAVIVLMAIILKQKQVKKIETK